MLTNRFELELEELKKDIEFMLNNKFNKKWRN